ncbi:hypothetical protein [Agromyces cerinus]|uniref:hypothetical protein n=1 Tax=Agromyces cerinus TaxID=33878 RepID=UPI0011780976|nr:hypothetical protein [Agromyces cerinus]
MKIDGVAEWDVAGLQLTEDATPVDPSSSFGGAGDFSFSIPANVDAKLIVGLPVEVVDTVLGVTRGVIAAVGMVGDDVRAQCTTRLVPLVADRNAALHVGTVESYLTYVFGLCDVTTGVVFDPSIADIEVTAVGWSGNVWLQVKQFCIAYQVEVAVVGTDIVVRPLRGQRASRVDESAFEWGMDGTGRSQTVESWYYETTPVTDAVLVGRTANVISSLGAGEVYEFQVDLDCSLSSVEQPVAMDSVAYSEASASVYSVRDRLDNPVDASYWVKQGGSVSVSIADDTRSITVKVTGCLDATLAPYRLVGTRVVHGQDVEYSTLRVLGSGLAFKRKLYSMPACVDGSATVEVGCEVDNDFITSWAHAHSLLLWAAVRYGSPQIRVSGQAVLGAGAGARILDDFTEYRVRTVSRGPSGEASYEAEWDTTLGDLDAVWGEQNIGEFNDAHSTIGPYNVRPLTT